MKPNEFAGYAGFVKRACAFVIDWILIFPVGFILASITTEGVYISVSTGVWWAYCITMESSSTQATFGKMALGIKVTDLSGNRISIGRATGRMAGKIISTITLSVGFLMVIWTKKKQGLHDIFSDCLVVNKAVSVQPDAGYSSTTSRSRPLDTPKGELVLHKKCPVCGSSNVRWAFTEDGNMGDWCYNCKKSLKTMGVTPIDTASSANEVEVVAWEDLTMSDENELHQKTEEFPYKTELERRIYAHILEEQKDEATMLQARALSDGDSEKAEICYYKLRYAQIVESGAMERFKKHILNEKEAQARAKQEAEAKAREEARAKAREEAEAKAKEEARAKAREEAEAKAKEEARAKAREEAEVRKRAEAKARRKAMWKKSTTAEKFATIFFFPFFIFVEILQSISGRSKTTKRSRTAR